MAAKDDCLEFDWRGKLFMSEKYSDCSILVKTFDSSTRFPGHAAILASASEVFADILDSPSEEKGRVIVMNDVNPHAVAKVLEYVYLGNVKFSDWKFVSDMTRIASKYKIKNLVQKCSHNLRKQITLQNVCSILEVAISSDLEELEEECKAACREGGFVVLHTNAFHEANPVIVKTILSIPDLQVPSEMSVFRAAWSWSTYRCCKEEKAVYDENVANEMSSLLECIGLEFMSEEEQKSIPKAALEILRKRLDVKNEDNALEDETYSKLLTKGRKMTFPMNLLKFCKIFELDFVGDDGIHLAGNITLMRFTVNTRVYLKSISYGFTVANKPRPQTASFHIHNKRGKLVSFSETVEANSESEEISELFRASDLLAIEADEVHTIEVDVGSNHKNFIWFLTSLKRKRLGDVELTVLTESCYGIYQLGFIEAS